jgi:hypothetical protein
MRIKGNGEMTAQNKELVLEAHEAFIGGDGKKLFRYLAGTCILYQCGRGWAA